MDDLENYRQRIGLFSSASTSMSGAYFKMAPLREKFSYLVCFLITISLATAAQISDPSIELNPGPTDNDNVDLKKLYKDCRIIDSDITRICSHRYFLQICSQIEIIPKGMMPNISISACKPNEDLIAALNSLSKEMTLEQMKILLQHYDSQLQDLVKERQKCYQSLRESCPPEQFNNYLIQLDYLKQTETETLQSRKLKKINMLLDQNPDTISQENKWLPDLHLTTVEQAFILEGQEICDQIINAAMILLNRDFPFFTFQSSSMSHSLLTYCPFETIHVHHNGHGHFCTSSSIGGKVHLYDSLNTAPSPDLMLQISTLYSPDPATTPTITQVQFQSRQEGSVDCGIFAIAYATELAHGNDPSSFIFDQASFRSHLFTCLELRKIKPFPKHKVHQRPSDQVDVTRDIDPCEKWSLPKRPAPSQPDSHCPEELSINVSNRFEPLQCSTPTRKKNNRKEDLPKQHTVKPNVPTSRANTVPPAKKKHSNIVNLSNRRLTDPESRVLELGLTFCPSVKDYNKEKVVDDYYKFIRRLKLAEYFHENPSKSSQELPQFDEDRSKMNWTPKNPDWYPDAVRNKRSASLTKFIDKLLIDSKENLLANKDSFWSNLDNAQRQAIRSLADDDSIVIKPSDKDGSIVIMDTKQYEQECLSHLSNQMYYEELNDNPNDSYKKQFTDEIQDLHDNKFITNLESDMLQQGHRTPVFYGLPKTHKPYDTFPKLRPICSGHSSVSVRMSELVDSFLKAAATKTASYVQDTTDFINKIRNKCFGHLQEEVFFVTMDVESLYPNIDHEEGVAACEKFLNQRKNQKFPTSRIGKLIRMILSCNTLSFMSRFFHQIKGTAMGTPMAVNFANLFMASFEEAMLNEYFKQHGKRPNTWLRYIDDIFFVWTGSEESLKHFLNFCNAFAENKNMKSTIKFTTHYSKTSVTFLDITVKLVNNKVVTTLYTKPTASHDYLHRSSYHVQHILKSLPLSQFIRIRRICSNLSDYWKNTNEFIQHFKNRGYKENDLRKCAQAVSARDREELLTYKKRDSSTRIPLVLTWHHKFRDLPNILHDRYKAMIKENPDMKAIFPEPPLVSFRRSKNLADQLTRADHTSKRPTPQQTTRDRTSTDIDKLINDSGTVTNIHSKATFKICGGKATDSDVIYSATCTKHNKMYVGQTSQPLNERFNGHRSDIRHHPDRCELGNHFATNDCDFNKDLSISILEKISGSTTLREYHEEKWMIRLSSIVPQGLNSHYREYATLYKKLF